MESRRPVKNVANLVPKETPVQSDGEEMNDGLLLLFGKSSQLKSQCECIFVTATTTRMNFYILK